VRKLESSLTVDIPRRELDRPSWVRVGVIAAVGFVIGVAWPKLAGVRLGPSAPGESASVAAGTGGASGTASVRANDALPGTVPAAASAAPTASAPAPGPVATTQVGTKNAASVLAVKSGQITSCRTQDGESLKGKACGALAFDAIALPRLKGLGTCPAAADADGKLAVMVHLDFAKSRVTSDIGKSSTIASPDAFASCLKPALEGAPLAAVAHEHPRYTVTYALRFTRDKASNPSKPGAATPQGSPTPQATQATQATPTPQATPAPEATSTAPTPTPSAKPGDGTEIVWEVAIVRDAPKTGAVIARLARGTKIQVGAPQDGWYKVKFDAAPSEGWVYRGSIGK
jgi:Bacterial SH3 domain